jgi:hypothetical protein
MGKNVYGRYQTDEKAEVEGVELDFGDGMTVKVRSMESPIVREFQNKQMRKHRQTVMANGGLLPPALQDKMEIEVLVKAVIVGWQGVLGPDGKELPFNPENVTKVLTDLREFRKEISSLASMNETFRKEALEGAKGN